MVKINDKVSFTISDCGQFLGVVKNITDKDIEFTDVLLVSKCYENTSVIYDPASTTYSKEDIDSVGIYTNDLEYYKIRMATMTCNKMHAIVQPCLDETLAELDYTYVGDVKTVLGLTNPNTIEKYEEHHVWECKELESRIVVERLVNDYNDYICEESMLKVIIKSEEELL